MGGMDHQTLLNILFGALSTGLGWFARELWSAVKELKSDLSKLREEMPREYVSRGDFRESLTDVKVMLNKIFDRLDTKADKRHGD